MSTTLKNNTILIATGNAHKIQEIQSIFSSHNFQTNFITPSDINISPSIEETGNSFLENALLKARAYHSVAIRNIKKNTIPNFIVLAEDSGLCIEALDGRPHIYSARYEIDAFENDTHTMPFSHFQCKKILEEMEGHSNRKAHFVCCAVLLWQASHHTEEYIVCEKTWHGEIISPEESTDENADKNTDRNKQKTLPKQLNGFGYDPIFYIPALQCTAAALSPQEKNTHSHRGQAMTTLTKHIY